MCNRIMYGNDTSTNEIRRLQTKTVRISADPEVVSFDKISCDEKGAVWYSKQSLRDMSAEGLKLAKKNRSARGLENMSTHEDFMYHRMHVRDVINTVLCEQHNQKSVGMLDHERIALVSLRMTEMAAKEARRIGKSDQKEANKWIDDEKERLSKNKLFHSFMGVCRVGKAFRTKRQFVAKQC